MKKLVLMFSLVALAFAFVSCGEDETTLTPTSDETSATIELAQGVTDTTVTVGNTAAVSGLLADVGIPFNVGLEAYFEMINEAGGVDGRTINFITYDDTFNAELGVTYTETLVEEDEVFALVGHFGTPTVGATVDYIQDIGIPMVYAATGINSLYFEADPANPLMAVQPIYMTDGRIMAARAVNEALYGEAGDENLADTDLIGVLYTNDDAGNSMRVGIETEMEILGVASTRVIYIAVSPTSIESAVLYLKSSGVKTVLAAMNQYNFPYTMTAIENNDLFVPIFTSYVNASVTYVDDALYSADRPIYANAWLDLSSEEGAADYADFVTCISSASGLTTEEIGQYSINSFAIAGYVAAKVFVDGLERVAANDVPLTWENYIAAMEESPIDIPMGGVIDFTGGKRWGIDEMALLLYELGDNPYTTEVTETDYEAFVKVREIESVSDIEAK